MASLLVAVGVVGGVFGAPAHVERVDAARVKAVHHVTIPNLGVVAGVTANASDEVAFFGGIQFGQAPVGDLRWQPPRPFGPWEGVRDAQFYGAMCSQPTNDEIIPQPTPVSEDCLNLNVYAPVKALNGAEKLPVMVWLHGGGYAIGNGEYPGGDLVLSSDNQVIVVTLNYRLGAFGYLASEELQRTTSDGSAGNFGIQDQRLAMMWVRDHIAAFGGDPDAVTLFGESAGGSAVINHLATQDSFPLYRAAIVMSGAYNKGAISMSAATDIYNELREATRCPDVACLKTLSDTQIIESFAEGLVDGPNWNPVVDGKELLDFPLKLIEDGRYNNKVPVMVGSTRDEGAMFTIKEASPTMTQLEYDLMVTVMGDWNWGQRSQLKRLYNPETYPYPKDLGPYSRWWWQATRVLTDTVPGLGPCGVRNLNRMLHKGGTPAIYSYLFGQPTQCDSSYNAEFCEKFEREIPGIVTDETPYTVPHACELYYAFGFTKWMPPGEQIDVSKAMSKHFHTFGRTAAVDREWPTWNPDEDNSLVFQGESLGGIKMETNLRSAACDWHDENPPFVN